jgi:trehalose 6-phosphate synthase/phosphatase
LWSRPLEGRPGPVSSIGVDIREGFMSLSGVDLHPSARAEERPRRDEVGRLIVVSNRLPLTLRRGAEGWRAERSPGGLATALGPVVSQLGGMWIGWPGEAPEGPDADRQGLLERWEEIHGFVTVDLPSALSQRFYQGYSNQTLWPLFHHFPSRLVYDPEGWEAYVEANRLFRDAVLARHKPGDLVWVHDYHLMLLPQLLREAAPEAAIGFFLHIPFPSSDVFRVLPRREELLRGLLGADYIAFQTHAHLQHFRASLLRILGVSSRMDRVEADGRFARIEALPIGISPEDFTGPLDSDPEVRKSLEDLRSRFAGLRILLAVDRLDYTKGIPERLRALRRLLERVPELRGRVVLVQIAVPSRERIPLYSELRREVNELVGEINGSFGTPEWTPVVYIRRSVTRAELVALYAASDVGWVTPLLDGMNLVAKEYVACQRGGEGVLLLSEFAGAAAEMGEELIVNPYDEERTAAALERALSLPAEERRERMAQLHNRVLRNNALAWSERFLKALRAAATSRREMGSEVPRPLPVREAVESHGAADRRLLMLDYDGTLVPYASRPRDAVPPREVLSLLGRLVRQPNQQVALVSGRPRGQLEQWFGQVDGLWLAAEHGAMLRPVGVRDWEPLRNPMPVEWKTRVRPVLEHFVDRTPGSFVEEKEYCLVWHHRMADPEFGEWLANELVAVLEELLAETELRAVRGVKSVEVKLIWANKGEVLAHIERTGPAPAFRLAIGDDRTDEDLFERMPPDAWTVHVGDGPSLARFRLPQPWAVRRFLEEIAAAQ